jgi:hypothetical protein
MITRVSKHYGEARPRLPNLVTRYRLLRDAISYLQNVATSNTAEELQDFRAAFKTLRRLSTSSLGGEKDRCNGSQIDCLKSIL